MKELPDPKIITKPKQLAALADDLSRQPRVAVDTESNSLYAFRERVCLVQFSTPENDYLVDPLALADLTPLEAVLAGPDIEKVFHAGEYDVLTLKRDYGFGFASLFDTMIAARILGRKAVGLGNMLEAEFGVRLEKRYQRANWGKRPLPPEMLKYARLDTHYLIALRDRLRAELKEGGRWPIAEEDFARLARVDGHDATPPETEVWRMNGTRQFEPRQMAVLQALVDYRREKARQIDRPLFKVLGDKTLVEVAAAEPRSLPELREVHGMTSRQLKRHGEALLEAVRRGLEAEPPSPPRRRKYDEELVERVEALREWRKGTARGWGVESDVILPRDVLDEIARQNPASRDELAEIMKDVPWRLERFGGKIWGLLSHYR